MMVEEFGQGPVSAAPVTPGKRVRKEDRNVGEENGPKVGMNVSVEWEVEDDESDITSTEWYVGKVTKVLKKKNRMYVKYAEDSSGQWHDMKDTDWRNLDEEEEDVVESEEEEEEAAAPAKRVRREEAVEVEEKEEIVVEDAVVEEEVAADESEEVEEVEEADTACFVCGSSEDEHLVLLCDGCPAEYHIGCLSPPLDALPEEDEWLCPTCRPQEEAAVEAKEGDNEEEEEEEEEAPLEEVLKEVKTFTVKILKAALEARGLSDAGLKKVLAKRLCDAIKEEYAGVAAVEEEVVVAAPKSAKKKAASKKRKTKSEALVDALTESPVKRSSRRAAAKEEEAPKRARRATRRS